MSLFHTGRAPFVRRQGRAWYRWVLPATVGACCESGREDRAEVVSTPSRPLPRRRLLLHLRRLQRKLLWPSLKRIGRRATSRRRAPGGEGGQQKNHEAPAKELAPLGAAVAIS